MLKERKRDLERLRAENELSYSLLNRRALHRSATPNVKVQPRTPSTEHLLKASDINDTVREDLVKSGVIAKWQTFTDRNNENTPNVRDAVFLSVRLV